MLRLQGLEIHQSEIPQKDFFKTPNVWMLYQFGKNQKGTKEPLLLMEIGVGLQRLVGVLNTKNDDNKVCYVLMNYQYTSPSDGVKRTRPLFISWAPDQAHVREKVKITSYYAEARKQLYNDNGNVLDVQANDFSDITDMELLSKIKIKTTHF